MHDPHACDVDPPNDKTCQTRLERSSRRSFAGTGLANRFPALRGPQAARTATGTVLLRSAGMGRPPSARLPPLLAGRTFLRTMQAPAGSAFERWVHNRAWQACFQGWLRLLLLCSLLVLKVLQRTQCRRQGAPGGLRPARNVQS